MINQQPNPFKTVRDSMNKLKSRLTVRNLLIGSLIFIILLLILTLLLSSQKSKSDESSPKPTISPTPAQKIEAKNYLLNGIVNMKKPVTGYSWTSTEQLLYSTPTGMYIAATNEPLIERAISQISWSNVGSAVFLSKNKWYYFNNLTNEVKELTLTGNNVSMSPNGQRIASFSGSQITYIDTLNLNQTSINLEQPIANIQWSPNSTWIAVGHELKDNTIIKVFDNALNLKAFHTLKPGSYLLALSPSGTKVAINEDNILIVKNSSETQTSIPIEGDYFYIKAIFETDVQLIYIITTIDRMGRKISDIFRLNKDGVREYIGNDMPIPGRFNLDGEIFINNKQTALALIENNSYVWLIALKPNLLPSFNQAGLSFFPLKSGGNNHDLPESYGR